MKATKDNPTVELVFESSKGTKVYAMKDLTQISAFRGVAAEKSKRFSTLCMTEQEAKDLVQEGIEAFNKQDLTKAAAIFHEMKFRLTMICEENSLLELAYIYLMIEGEDIERPSRDFNKKKAEKVEEEPDIKGFFLRTALQLVDNFSQKPDVDLLNYLEETKNLVLKLGKFSQVKS